METRQLNRYFDKENVNVINSNGIAVVSSRLAVFCLFESISNSLTHWLYKWYWAQSCAKCQWMLDVNALRCDCFPWRWRDSRAGHSGVELLTHSKSLASGVWLWVGKRFCETFNGSTRLVEWNLTNDCRNRPRRNILENSKIIQNIHKLVIYHHRHQLWATNRTDKLDFVSIAVHWHGKSICITMTEANHENHFDRIDNRITKNILGFRWDSCGGR